MADGLLINLWDCEDVKMLKTKLIPIFILLVFLVGCANININPQTPRQKLAFAWTLYNGVMVTANSYYDRGLIDEDFTREVVRRGKQIEASLDTAETYMADNKASLSESMVVEINRLLIELNNELLERRKP